MKYSAGLWISLATGASAASLQPTPDDFDWASVTPSKDLKYHACFNDYKCARLIVPRDWHNETDGHTVTIAIAKLPAVVPDDDPTFAGTILTNPGGPGGSGVSYLLNAASHLQKTIDIPGKKHYEILSFDPRGIGHTLPTVDCFEGNVLARDAATLSAMAVGAVDASDSALIYTFNAIQQAGKRCAKVMADVIPYVNTPSVARDMVAMVDKIDELRKKESSRKGDGEDEMLELRSVKDTTPRLQYIGFSYGTVLGNYFSALFPERVGRVVLDGVVDTDDYATGRGWLTATHDSDEMVELFFKGCFKAGNPACKLYRPGDKKPSDIKKRVFSWIEHLDKEPITSVTPDGNPLVWRSGDIRGMIFSLLYAADQTFQGMSEILDEGISGNVTVLTNTLAFMSNIKPIVDYCPVANRTFPTGGINEDAYSAISCTDGDASSGKKVGYWRKYIKDQAERSSVAGGGVAQGRITCAGVFARPNWEYKGPFTTPKASKDSSAPEKGRPAAPLLFLSNRWDPVTPLTSARNMYKQHPGAGLVVADGMGHCAAGSGIVSKCTQTALQQYFDKGTVPKGEIECEGVRDPWDQVSALSAEDAAHLDRMLQRRTFKNMFGI